MNKKIFTLLAGALLVGSASAYAAGVDVSKVTAIEKGYYVLSGTQVTSSTSAADYFKLEDGRLKKVAANLVANYNKSLWTITASAASSNHFTFVNKATGETLSFDPKNAVVADAATGAVTPPTATTDPSFVVTGANMAWAWVENSSSDELENVKKLTFALGTDSTMALAVNSSNVVYAFKYANAKASSIVVTPLTIQAVKPATVVMTAANLNVLKDDATNDKYFTLTPNKKNLKVDVISGVKFVAAPADATGYVTLKELGTNKYLRVDTAVHAATGLNENKLYQLARKELKAGETVASSVPNNFKIEKDLFKDSVFVSIAKDGSRFTYSSTPNANGSHWATPLTTGTPFTYCTLSSILLTPTTEVMTFYEPETPQSTALKKENLLFAVSDAATAVDSKTSVEDGLYYIKNAKGQYLASPIYNNGSSAEWITVNADEQNVAHMPAFQWVVLKDNTSDYAKEKSTVTLINREFDAKKAGAVQLYKNAGGTYYYVATTINTNQVNINAKDSLNFTKIEDMAILGDSLLGYKNLTANDLKVNRYTFNYFNPYVSDKFIGKSTDSLLVVKDAILPFVVKAEGDIADYGYTVANANGRIEGLKQLRRQAYTMTVPAATGDLKFGVNAESKYAVSADADFDAVTFFFKENNDVQRTGDDERNDFYALVVNDNPFASKAGVSDETQDATLKEQLIGEVRTSSFLIAPYDAPLYRRFNTTLEGAVAGDGPDTVRFVEQYRKEYLQIEGNKSFTHGGIDFLGIYADDKAPSGLGFIVDTAWVNRGAGYIKPQYLISIERTDKAATPGKACTEGAPHFDKDGNVTTAENCVHATPAVPGFQFGKYLVNFEDSLAVAGNEDIYAWKKYTRAGFVKAAHVGDSLYILNGMFADITAKDFDPALIRAAVKDGKYAAKYIVDLTGDNHKPVTWSFRYVNPAKAATDDKRFLIESMATDSKDIAPVTANWLKMQNGCLVLSDDNSEFDIFTGDDDALIFDVEYKANDEVATDNENVSASTVSVIAGNGTVTVKGAAGKKVTISNILGQTIANTVLTSDEATIAAPAGVVVVAVEGEAAVKAIVK